MWMNYHFSRVTRREPLNRQTVPERLKIYARAHGFQFGKKVYFANNWSPRAVSLLEKYKKVRRAGTPEDLIQSGIDVPKEFADLYPRTVLYEVDASLLD